MELKDLLAKEICFFNLEATSKEEAIDILSKKIFDAKFVTDSEKFKEAIWKRENQDSTGIGEGIAIPHVLMPFVKKSAIAFATIKKPINWDSIDGVDVDLVFLIMTNGKDGNEHLEALASLSSYLVKAENQSALRSSKSYKDVINVFKPVEKPKEDVKSSKGFDIVGITACPTGIAHTYLAAEKLEEYARNLGLNAKIETQGRRGVDNRLTEDDIKNAKYIILAHDKAIQGLGRFNGFQVIDTSTQDAIYNGKKLIEEYNSNPNLKSISGVKDNEESGNDFDIKKFLQVKNNLLAGVSRMLPFVVAGGIILGIGFLLDYIYITANGIKAIASEQDFDSRHFSSITFEVFKSLSGYLTENGDKYYYSGSFGTVWVVAHFFSGIGKVGMELMIPILAAYVCYSIVGSQGLMVGAVAGLFSMGDSFVYGDAGSWKGAWSRFLPDNISGLSSGFIGALVGAYIGALIVFGLTKLMSNIHKGLTGVRDIVFIPVLSLLGIALAMLAINIPLGYVMIGLQDGITFLAEHNLLFIVCVIIGTMMCVDMGGPINKIAYVIGTLAVGNQIIKDQNPSAYNAQTMIMTASLVGGMVPPLAIAISSVIMPKAWTIKEKDQAKSNWLMGACFITEGAIPFMINDPKRIVGSSVVGGAIAGAIVGIFKITITAPHGGIFVSPLTNATLFDDSTMQKVFGIVMFFAAVIIGSIVTSIILGFWRLSDINKGKLVLDGSNGTREALEAKIEKYKNNKNKVKALNSKLSKLDTYEKQAIEKRSKYEQLVIEKQNKKSNKVKTK